MPNNKKRKRGAEAARTQRRSGEEISQALHYAAVHNVLSTNDVNVMSALAAIAAGADVNYSRDSWSCLMKASLRGHAEIVALLLNSGAETEARNGRGVTALLWAAQNGHAECLQLLLNAGADKDTRTAKGSTPGRIWRHLRATPGALSCC
jgi:ankyrin repeat protein